MPLSAGTAEALDRPRHPLPPAADAPLVGLRGSSAYLPELESVRGIAILMVLAYHVDSLVRFPYIQADRASWPMAFVQAGFTGVNLFFVLSAFLLSLPFFTDASGGRPVVLGDYFARRALRILPLYYVAVVVDAALSAEHPGDMVRWVPFLFFLNAVSGLTEPGLYHGVWWSLATEVQFYLLLPLLLVFLRSRPGRWAGVVFLGLYAFAYAKFVSRDLKMQTIAGQLHLTQSIFGSAIFFLTGILGAAVYHRFGQRIRARLARSAWLRNGSSDVLMLAVVIALGVYLQWLVSIGVVRQQSAPDHPSYLICCALWLAFILLLLLAPLRAKWLFSNFFLRRIGVLSYSIYLIHLPLLMITFWASRRTWPGVFNGWSPQTAALMLTLCGGCVLLSMLTYRFIERPFLVRKARFDS